MGLVGLLAICAAASACGGSAKTARPRGPLTVQVLAQTTQLAKTARVTVAARLPSPEFLCDALTTTTGQATCPRTSISASGVIDFVRNEYHEHVTWNTPGIFDRTVDDVLVANHVYVSNPGKSVSPRLA